MDIRIVNTCNNNCLFCLEQSYRNKNPFIPIELLSQKLVCIPNDTTLTFYWWNPLLHPDLIKIIKYARTVWFQHFSILSNTGWITSSLLDELISLWLSTFWFYFHAFHSWYHDIITQGWLNYGLLLKNMELLKNSRIGLKAIIHINNISINSIYRDIILLNKVYGVKEFEFINYFPFDRPYEKYKQILQYDITLKRDKIDQLFRVIKKLNFRANFVKFSRDFFWEYDSYYNYEKWVLSQISDEDILRLDVIDPLLPFCFEEHRCPECFIKDNCRFYDERSSYSSKNM